MGYIDKNGYKRGNLHTDLIHRQVAYKYIYSKNRFKYPLPFSEYQVHHIDGNKKNNNYSNLLLLTKVQHEKIHGLKDITHEDIEWLHDLGLSKWQIKKIIANQGDFSTIALLFGKNGKKVIGILKIGIKFGLFIGLIFWVLFGIIHISNPDEIWLYFFYSSYFFLGIFALCFFLMILFFVMGIIHNKLGNFFEGLKKDFNLLFEKKESKENNKQKTKKIINSIFIIVAVLFIIGVIYYSYEKGSTGISVQNTPSNPFFEKITLGMSALEFNRLVFNSLYEKQPVDQIEKIVELSLPGENELIKVYFDKNVYLQEGNTFTSNNESKIIKKEMYSGKTLLKSIS